MRGNHENAKLNKRYGFKKECIDKVGETSFDSIQVPTIENFKYLSFKYLNRCTYCENDVFGKKGKLLGIIHLPAICCFDR